MHAPTRKRPTMFAPDPELHNPSWPVCLVANRQFAPFPKPPWSGATPECHLSRRRTSPPSLRSRLPPPPPRPNLATTPCSTTSAKLGRRARCCTSPKPFARKLRFDAKPEERSMVANARRGAAPTSRVSTSVDKYSPDLVPDSKRCKTHLEGLEPAHGCSRNSSASTCAQFAK